MLCYISSLVSGTRTRIREMTLSEAEGVLLGMYSAELLPPDAISIVQEVSELGSERFYWRYIYRGGKLELTEY